MTSRPNGHAVGDRSRWHPKAVVTHVCPTTRATLTRIRHEAHPGFAANRVDWSVTRHPMYADYTLEEPILPDASNAPSGASVQSEAPRWIAHLAALVDQLRTRIATHVRRAACPLHEPSQTIATHAPTRIRSALPKRLRDVLRDAIVEVQEPSPYAPLAIILHDDGHSFESVLPILAHVTQGWSDAIPNAVELTASSEGGQTILNLSGPTLHRFTLKGEGDVVSLMRAIAALPSEEDQIINMDELKKLFQAR